MPKNAVKKSNDGRKRYRYTDKAGNKQELRQRRNELITEFKYRCEKAEAAPTLYRMTFDELFHKWQEEHQIIFCRERDYKTLNGHYEYYLKSVIGNLKISNISRSTVYSLLIKAIKGGAKSATINKIRACISRPYNWAINTLGYKISNPTSGLIIKNPNNEVEDRADEVIRICTDDELDRFFMVARNKKYFNFYLQQLMTGFRPSEGAAVSQKIIINKEIKLFESITLEGPGPMKTPAARRDFPIFPNLQKVLDDQISKCPANCMWLYPAGKGKPSLNAIILSFKRIRANTAVLNREGKVVIPPVTFSLYDFRHTFATKASESLPPKTLQYLMGHKDINVTMRYYVGITAESKIKAGLILSLVFESGKNGGN